MFIKEAKGKIIKDSRKEETVEFILKTYKGRFVCSAPIGKSRIKAGEDSYNEKGIKKSVSLLRRFCRNLENKNFLMKELEDLVQLDLMINDFEKKYGLLGKKVVYVLHGAFLKAAARDNNVDLWEFIHMDVNRGQKVKLPMPVGNAVGGGLHSKVVRGRRPDFQEFLFIPDEARFSKAVTKNVRSYALVKHLLRSRYINDENAVRTDKTNEEVLYIMLDIAQKMDVRIGIDLAASSFYDRGYYNYKNKELKRDRVEQIDYVKTLMKKYGMFYCEDVMQENDFIGFRDVLSRTNGIPLVVGDDLIASSPKRLKRAIRAKAINAVVIKPDEAGSLIAVKEIVNICKENKIKMVFSHRSGETMDDVLADYAVGFGAHFLKTGIEGKERLIKLKRVMDIEKSIS